MTYDGPVFDADSHVIEPPDALTGSLPESLQDRGPRMERRDGSDWVVCDGRAMLQIGRLAGLARGERRLRTTDDDLKGDWERDILAGAHSATARLADMDRDGIDRAIVFPTLGMMFYSLDDPSLVAALLRSYNDWLADLCGQAEGRLVPVCMLMPDDVDASVTELRRARELGHRLALVPIWEDGSEPYWSERFDPLYAAAAELQMPIGFHAFAGRRSSPSTSSSSEAIVSAVVDRSAEVQRILMRLIISGVFERHPMLRWFSAENDAGWASWFLERADEAFHRTPDSFACRATPGEVFGQHISLTFMRENTAVVARHQIGLGSVLWGSDYPHNVSTWPGSRQLLSKLFADADVPEQEAACIAYSNALQLVGGHEP